MIKGLIIFDKKSGFTMAEVLITIGIIGVVAAMTMSTLIANAQKKEFSARLKKFYSIMTQAITLSENVNGPVSQWNKLQAVRDDGGTLIDQPDETVAFFKNYFAPFIQTVEIGKKKLETTSTDETAFVALIDGSAMYIVNGNCFDILFDANGNKNPNIEGQDRFRFLLCTSEYNEYYIGKNKYFGSYRQDAMFAKGREYIKQMCQTNRMYCSSLIMYDNWEFKKDYPWYLPSE